MWEEHIFFIHLENAMFTTVIEVQTEIKSGFTSLQHSLHNCCASAEEIQHFK